MSNKKHIDRIFQESFKDFEAKPNPELWSKIQNEMALETEKPKAFPIWMSIASIAAVLAVLVTIGSVVFTGTNNPAATDKKIVDTQTRSSDDVLNSNKTTGASEKNSTNKNNIVVDDPKATSNNPSEFNNESIANTDIDSNGNPIASENSERDSITNSDKLNNATASSSRNTAVANSENRNTKNANSNYANKPNTIKNSNSLNNQNNKTINNGIASQDNTSNPNKNGLVNESNTTSNSVNNTIEATNNVVVQESEASENAINNSVNRTGIAANSVSNNSSETDKLNAITTNETVNNTNKTIQNNNNNTVASTINSANQSNKTASDVQRAVSTSETDNLLKETSAQNAIAWNAKTSNTPQNEKEKEENLMVGDSLVSESPSIEEAIAQAEETSEKEEDEKLVNRWQVQANIAPVYYNSLGKGSHIDDEFVSNSKSGETNTSYGVNVSYAISKKLAIRSGISSLNLSYDTDNVILYNSPITNTPDNTNPLRNINLEPGSTTLNAFSGDNLGFQQINNELYNAAISQRLSYYEVPVELEYKLVNNRFGVNIIGGMSTFFLNDNEVYSEFEEYKTYIGEANNVNSVSFSTNLGIGLNYKFTDKLLFNFEPTFKYQLNGFDNTSGDFRPYIIGVYTGFSYKF
ncbi:MULTISPECIES: hypothetical protein [Bizionia]|uniref:Outer membrane protein beta-barrel domain-containing protein n=1 Tax=Bizionia algoritergicola TaxID=291187 RepID=A0A5D0R2I5_9FLAO|nr:MULTISPECIES: hypothetical protein [Bizionia]OBX21881.1 hypothetical protein BAA08_11070 [Bizionia sp. APA-3]TYB75021.1 hypothetical protein ES675_02485 [Bizionia algoritergicola]